MWLFGGFLLVLGLLGLVAMKATIRRYGPSGGISGAGGPQRAQQNLMVVRWMAIAGAAILVLNLAWVLLT